VSQSYWIEEPNMWIKLKNLLRNRNFILIFALVAGLLWGKGAQWTEGATLPALAIIMTLSTMGVPGSAFRSFRSFWAPAMAGIVMNYFLLGSFLLGSFLLGLNAWLIHDETLRAGFIIIAAVPPAVASTFLLGWAIEGIGKSFRVLPKTLTSLLLLGTLKNYGLAGGLALALFSKKTSVPATVSSVFMIVYIIWLQFKRR